MSKFKLFCILTLLVLLAVPAYAEVQNVKVSGDLAARWIIRNEYDLDQNGYHDVTGVNPSDSSDDFLMSTAEVQVDADLTDNVSTVVRLVNQRTWGDNAALAVGTVTTRYDMIVDLANVTLKELVYSPLTVTIGRQDLWYGKGFIIGAKARDPKGAIFIGSGAPEYTAINSFDAIKGTLDFDPWKIDAVYSLIEENTINKADDVFLYGANVGYKFNSYNGEAEAYMFRKQDESKAIYPDTTTSVACQDQWISTWGIRGSFEPIANATIAAEGALQYGRDSINTTTAARSRKGSALDISGTYNLKDIRWTPKLGLEYIFYSGESETASSTTGTYHAWDPMYRGKFDSAIREFQNVYYQTAMREDNHAATPLDMDAGTTNETQYIVSAVINPINNLKVDGRFAWFRADKPMKVSSAERPKDIGTELDLTLTYDYTEDVSFGLLAAWFFPGKYWLSGQDDMATDLVGTVKVAF